MCSCGCNTCKTKIQGPLLTEGKVKSLLSEGLQYHIDKKIPLFETVYRIGSEKHLSLIKEARKMYSRNVINLCEEDEALIKTHLGEFALYEGESVPLDLPMLNEEEIEEAEFKGKDVPLNKPKRGGSKAYYVYVRDPKTKKIKKVSFGSGGLRAKIKNKEARNAFAARHNCKDKKDRTKAGYWSCNLPRYASALGLGANMNTFWSLLWMIALFI
ncbi:hypothetical protein N9Z41_00105 [bacterium]|nr:hypothetical protein [bacterium]